MNIFLRHKYTQKFTRKARGNKSITHCFITNMKISKVMQDMRGYRSTQLESDHYLIRAEVNCPPRWLNKKQKYFSKARIF